MTNTIGEEQNSSREPIRKRAWDEIRSGNYHKRPIDERVDAMTYVKPFPIKEVDLLTIKRFIGWSRFNAKNDWGVGLKQLLDLADADAKNVILFDRMRELENSVEGMSGDIILLKKLLLDKGVIEEMAEDTKKTTVTGFGGSAKNGQ